MANHLERWNQNHLEYHFRYVKMSVIKKKRRCVDIGEREHLHFFGGKDTGINLENSKKVSLKYSN